MAAKSAPKNSKPKSNSEILSGFQCLRQEQRQLANKITELEMDLNEHKIVIETLRGVSTDRKCFRMVSGVLVERTVGAVLPELECNREQLPRAVAALQAQLTAKGSEINRYMQEHNLRTRDSAPAAPAPSDTPAAPAAAVLVASQ